MSGTDTCQVNDIAMCKLKKMAAKAEMYNGGLVTLQTGDTHTYTVNTIPHFSDHDLVLSTCWPAVQRLPL